MVKLAILFSRGDFSDGYGSGGMKTDKSLSLRPIADFAQNAKSDAPPGQKRGEFGIVPSLHDEWRPVQQIMERQPQNGGANLNL